MGLFDFASNIGKKLFGSDAKPEEAAAKIQKELDAAHLGIKNLTVTVQGQKCSLAGDCPDFVAFQKAVLIAGNVEGVQEVEAKKLIIASAAQAAAEPKVDYYIIQKGDTLSKIAKQFYGNANDYPKIFAANKEVIQDPDKIFPGQKIRIPAKEA
ncbi:hypothetical protein CUZ56_00726 [Saezia sanguinis]|jgi:nucleoid-associated protein YgaU|uniref:Potassium binding protein Kbp n=1 Tax=Saezia sanguinis TaxID=1965230 RepID=A0A433SHK7_9BURK|nr:peptidoglycan-binding protein LysM [Saezia sanguinis]RUS68239.1 hypothetical protein CUZ56_00726 [Saezia sanguinis]